ncbi:MAG: 3-hydroxyacyl-CoA dehydrogenase NAD-binding domain-containing protein [Gammaproteobacteria bacterium]
MTTTFNHLKLSTDSDDVAWVQLDKQDASANTLGRDIMEELNECIAELESSTPKAVVFTSAKSSGFIAGADITEFTHVTTPDEVYELVRAGQQVLDRLEALPMPTVAMINGFALGGGLELALACDYRVVVDEDSARLGLPEVMLGIHPGFGGTVRTPRLVGPVAALDMMLTGRGLRPTAARKIGLVDAVVPRRHLERTARQFALSPPGKRKLSLKNKLLNSALARPLIAKMSAKQAAKKASKDHYPAPYAIIDLWKDHAGNPAQMYQEEARSISTLICGPTAQNLVKVFLLQDRMKSLGAGTDFPVDHVHVVGAGVMGGDIAAWCALKGMHVTLQDREAKYIAPAIKRAHALFAKKLRKPHLIQAAMDRLMPDVDGGGIVNADVIIEAIYENLEAKQALYATIEPRMKPGAVLATNTSSIKLEDLCQSLEQPQRLIGLHFFNPVAKMMLVEVIHSDLTEQAEVDKGIAFTRQISRLPLPCKSAPGFVVNRILFPYMIEAMNIGLEGVPLAAIDKAAKSFGMFMGPVELADTVGLDVSYHVAQVFAREFGMQVPDKLKQMVDAKTLGRKTCQGFYTWKKGKAVKPSIPSDFVPDSSLVDRLMLPLINEAAACLADGVVTDADLLDAGVIFGCGFAPFTAGPIHYAKTRGIQNVVDTLGELAANHGERFEPNSYWGDLDKPKEEHS